jgi:hypothetical protein
MKGFGKPLGIGSWRGNLGARLGALVQMNFGLLLKSRMRAWVGGLLEML